MSAAKSTSRTNGTNQEEEEHKQKSSTVFRAAVTIAAVGVTAWVLFDHTDTQEEEERKQKSSTVVEVVAAIAAVGVVAWGISRMFFVLVKIFRMLFENTDTIAAVAVTAWALSDITDTQEEEERKQKSSTVVGAAAAIAAVGVVAWGISRMLFFLVKISRMLFDNTWSPPPSGRFKMNTDATCRPVYNNTYGDSVQRGPAGYGGILRDHDGNWVRGFTGYIGVTDSLTAEFHGILKGLEFLNNKRRYQGAILETDSEAAYLWLIQPYKERSNSQIIKDIWVDIIEKCRRLVEKNNIEINHVRKGANRCADKLADVAIENKVKYKDLEDLPKEIYHLVSEDANKWADKFNC